MRAQPLGWSQALCPAHTQLPGMLRGIPLSCFPVLRHPFLRYFSMYFTVYYGYYLWVAPFHSVFLVSSGSPCFLLWAPPTRHVLYWTSLDWISLSWPPHLFTRSSTPWQFSCQPPWCFLIGFSLQIPISTPIGARHPKQLLFPVVFTWRWACPALCAAHHPVPALGPTPCWLLGPSLAVISDP